MKATQGTIFDAINRNFSRNPALLPSFSGSDSILIGSDYSGESKEEPYLVYSFLLAGNVSWSRWEPIRLQLRSSIFPDPRRMSYKRLGDSLRRKFLEPILCAADELDGLSISIAINKSIPSIFSERGPIDLDNPDFAAFRAWRPGVLDKAFAILNFVGFLLAGLGRQSQNVFWFTDEDQIAANPQMLTALTKALSWVASEYLTFDLGHLRCGTTACDDGSRQIEDFVCVPDLVAGALSEQFRGSLDVGARDDKIMWISGAGMREKAQPIMFWLANRRKRLKKHVFVIDPASEPQSHKVSWFNYGGGVD